MSIIDEKADTYVQERIDALYEIDCKIVSLLDGISSLFQTYSTSKQSHNIENLKDQVSEQTENVYNILSKVAIDLRKEVKIMDDNIGVYDKNKDGVMILPIGVEQKNTSLGSKKLNESLKQLDNVLGIKEENENEDENNDNNEDDEFETDDKQAISVEEVAKELKSDDVDVEMEDAVEEKPATESLVTSNVTERDVEVENDNEVKVTSFNNEDTSTANVKSEGEVPNDEDDDLFEDV
ncbi:mediator complex protein-domain-containing protein [Scheffersomyces amazonensis]|uniref:mediator complex protein-domain-containing protein n=1 Tax=Scheffersomyces amazonensis TaxID=1078765 RepID=UPI00315D222A